MSGTPDAEQARGWADWEIRRAIEAAASDELRRELQAELDCRREFRRTLPACDPAMSVLYPGST